VPGHRLRCGETSLLMKPRFEPDPEAERCAKPAAILFDPEAFDASEQQFAASLEPPTGRFVVDAHEGVDTRTDAHRNATSHATASAGVADSVGGAEKPQLKNSTQQATVADSPGSEPWRQEVAARLSHYRARRHPREPRYPSLRLKFEAGEPLWNTPAGASEPPVTASRQAVALDQARAAALPVKLSGPAHSAGDPVNTTEATAKIIEFPRFAGPPVALDELAEPVLDRPRILEATEVEPPPPALGGILIESPEESVPERRPGFEIPLQPAPMVRRLAATAIDAALVSLAFVGFVYLFLRIAATVPPLPQGVGTAIALIGFLWVAYQYLMLVRCGITPGLKLAKLQLNRFDGSPVPRRLRGWRLLTSILSAVSLGLGYAWCFFDEDQLCWHDRITRTYMAPEG
jgi:uncharacterized RDD family membrane protein YckC